MMIYENNIKTQHETYSEKFKLQQPLFLLQKYLTKKHENNCSNYLPDNTQTKTKMLKAQNNKKNQNQIFYPR